MGNKKASSLNTYSRYWGYVVSRKYGHTYWRVLLEDYAKRYNFSACVSPMHCPDVRLTDDELKDFQSVEHKDDIEPFEHWHIQIDYGDYVSLIKARNIAFSLKCGGGVALPIGDPYLHYRYLKHEDNPEKEQFPYEDRVCYNFYRVPEPTYPPHMLKMRLSKITRSRHITEFNQLLNYLESDNNRLGFMSWENFQLMEYSFKHQYEVEHVVKNNFYVKGIY